MDKLVTVSRADLLELCEAVQTVSYDSSGAIGRDGLLYCDHCGEYEDAKGKIKHHHGCITRMAEAIRAATEEVGDDVAK